MGKDISLKLLAAKGQFHPLQMLFEHLENNAAGML